MIDRKYRNSAERLATLGAPGSRTGTSLRRSTPRGRRRLFAHIAFWDRFVLERWGLAAERGKRTPMIVDG